MNQIPNTRTKLLGPLWLGALLALAGCGGSTEQAPAPSAAADVMLQLAAAPALDNAELPLVDPALTVRPTFHAAPVLLDPPDERDALDNAASASTQPREAKLSSGMAELQTGGLTVQGIESARRVQARSAPSGDESVTTLASSAAVITYTPAQIRAAYGLPPLPATGAALSAAQAAQLGAGQTIYIVDAMHDPNLVSELNAFNQKFGLPGCTVRPIAASASLPLAAAAPSDGCVLSVAYSTRAGGITNTPPAYDAGWATEITLDVQWAHATAPLARIVLIEAPDASVNSLSAAVQLANAMGPGVVSMSFGATEGNWTTSLDPAFTGKGMTYLAATGDSGVSVSWPSVSSNVIAVGGTTLTYTAGATRSEQVWSLTGGGVSQYVPTPSYQASGLPGAGAMPRRTVADVAFNANPSSGQYVAVIPQGSASTSWISAGGTSLSTPQWAGIVAVANAMRAQLGKAAVGAGHALLYGQIGRVPATYASAFADIRAGAHGTCQGCSAALGYDQASGLGSPNVSGLLTALSATGAALPPVVSPATISGTVGTALTFNVSVTASNPVTYTLTGAPAGMAISAAGLVSWAVPLAGSYTVTLTAKDSKTGLSGQGVYSVQIAAPSAPVVSSGAISGKVGVALAFTVTTRATNPVTYTLTGAPAGMVISTTGAVSWPKPVAGSFSVTVSARDTKTGLTGKGVYTVTIQNPLQPPVIKATALSGVAGKALSGSFSVTDPGGYAMAVSISGVPMGMGFSISGQTIGIIWAKPVLGNYTLLVSVRDAAGLTAQTTIPITITAK